MIPNEIIKKFVAIKNPYDKFFKIAFSIKSIARDYIQTFLPKDIQTILDLSSLELDNSSFVNEEFNDFSADLVYKCALNIKEKTEKISKKTRQKMAKIIFVFEHKSYSPSMPHLQLLQYGINKWTEDKTQGRAMTLNIPILIYHGESSFTKVQFSDYFDVIPKSLQRYFPDFEIFTTDLGDYPDEKLTQLIGKSMLLNTFLALKHSRDADYILQNMKKLLIFMEDHLKVDQEIARNFINYLMFFILNILPAKKRQKLPQAIQKLSSTMRTITKSIYDVIVEEANQKTDELNRKIQEMHKLLEEQKRQKEQVAKEVEAQKQKAAKERKKAEQEKKTLIKTLVLVANHSVEMTARLLNVSVDYVKVVMKEK